MCDRCSNVALLLSEMMLVVCFFFFFFWVLFIYLLNFKALNHIDLSFCTLIKGQCVLVIFEIYSLIVI